MILDVGGGTGAWSEPYRKALYDVRIIDPAVWPFLAANQVARELGEVEVHGILLAPPCTEFARSGGRWWKSKAIEHPEKLENAVLVVRDMLLLVEWYQPKWWALENPLGRLEKCVPELGKYRYTWHPWHYGDAELKRTAMWGNHVEPERTPVSGPYAEKVHRMSPSADRAALRSITPPGFAQAFFKANP